VDEVPINGDGFRLTLRVGDYERAAMGEVWDDNWLRGSVDIDIAQPPTATFKAKRDVAWQTTELQAFHESLARRSEWHREAHDDRGPGRADDRTQERERNAHGAD
jgi:hypothetical protein